MSPSPTSENRRLDLVLVGATGFTGRMGVAWLAEHAPPGLRWAAAGRDPVRMEAICAPHGLGPERRLVVDVLDEAGVDALVRQTRVIASTAGPYARLGSLLVAACARHGTHYCDITGETVWVRGLIDRHHEEAVASGARIVPFCGYDSVPADLGTWMMVRWIREEWGQPTRQVRALARAKGGFGGGSLASALGLLEGDGARALFDPFLLDPAGTQRSPEVQQASMDQRGVRQEAAPQGYSAPFLMAPINTRVVRRSEALLADRGTPYGEGFAYTEGMATGQGAAGWLRAANFAGVMGVLPLLGSLSMMRKLAVRLGPAPGEGPTEESIREGFFRYDLIALAADGREVRGRVEGQGDPGHHCTIQMLGASALCLALDGPRLPGGGGVGTPASSLGEALLDRLRGLGIAFQVPV